MAWYGRGTDKLTNSIFRSEKPEGKIKEVYDNEGLCHVWASGNIPRGRSHNMFFEYGVIYSFGRHYEAAKIFGDYVLINEDGYSPTTRKHLYCIRSAVSHKTLIQVPIVNPETPEEHEKNRDYLESNLFNKMMGIYTMSGWHGNGETFKESVTELNNYLKIFGLPGQVTLDQLNIDMLNECYETKEKKCTERREAREKRETDKCAVQQNELNYKFRVELQKFLDGHIKLDELKRHRYMHVTVGYAFGNERRKQLTAVVPSDLKEAYEKKITKINADKILAWRAGEINSLPYEARGEYALLRIKGNTVQTSMGADVPLDHALRLLNLIQTKRVRRGERVGHYTLESVDSLGDVPPVVTIGCHKILLSEAVTVLSNVEREQRLTLVEA
jgi:hypothetical protein